VKLFLSEPLAPPLIISKDEIDEGVAIMDIALEAVDAHTE
jgi:4-aminobutyrate aminotransferase-like enzyme